MIVDKLENLKDYYPIHPSLKAVDEFLKDFVENPKPQGRYELDGNNVFASVSQYETKPAEGRLCEAHKKYIDLQFLFKGSEYIGWAPLGELTMETEEYSRGGDIAFYSGEPRTWVTMDEGYFSLLFPQDAHMPCIKIGDVQNVIKIVVKIAAI